MSGIAILAPVAILLFLLGGRLTFYQPGRKRGRRRLYHLTTSGLDGETVRAPVRSVELSQIAWLNNILVNTPGMRALGTLMEQAIGSSQVVGFLSLSLLFFFLGLLLGRGANLFVALMSALALGLLPGLIIYRKKQQRTLKFEHQLPEALELVARSLRSGYPFTLGMQVVSDEFSDPIKTEFEKTVNEINYGNDVSEALRNLSRRVDCPDLLFFVTSVIVHMQVGGNLADVLDRTGRLIRQRFELHGRVRSLAAEGKLSAIILFALPFVLAFIINLLNPDYYNIMITNLFGQWMLLGAGSMMLVGAVVIKRMIKIRV